MGQQASAAPSPEPVQSAPRRCCGSSSDAPAPDKGQDTVSIQPSFLSGEDEKKLKVYKPQSSKPQDRSDRATPEVRHGFGCSIAGLPEPNVLVPIVGPRSATIHWSFYTRGKVKQYHVDVLQVPQSRRKGNGIEDAAEVAFFNVPANHTAMELPPGTLQRASGPYVVRVVAELDPSEKHRLSGPGYSMNFRTPAEAPSEVRGLGLASEPTQTELHVSWDAPADDGGLPLRFYQVRMEHSDGISTAVSSEQTVPTCSCKFGSLRPGSGPYDVTVRACNEAGIYGSEVVTQVCTAAGVPTQPCHVRAHLKPSHLTDEDLVQLEFTPPSEDGGRPLEHFNVVVFDHGDALSSGSTVPSAQPLTAGSFLCKVEVADITTVAGSSVLDGRWACDVVVPPNRVYRFGLEASNGVHGSGVCTPSERLLVPARVPPPPQAGPEVVPVRGSDVMEVRWDSQRTGGGLPLLAFKVGVLSPYFGSSVGEDVWDPKHIVRELTVSLDAALGQGAKQRKGLKDVGASRSKDFVKCAARVSDLDANQQYRFMVAASNSLGTGCWSKPSQALKTPLAAPLAPSGAVATLALSPSKDVVVSVSWEIPPSSDSRPITIGFRVRLLQVMDGTESKTSNQALGLDRTEFVSVVNAPPGPISWSTALSSPGRHRVEVTAIGEKSEASAPAVLHFEARSDLFLAQGHGALYPPRWAEEPIIALGAAAMGKSNSLLGRLPRVGSDPSQWPHLLLLWHDQMVAEAAVDVICCFRHPEDGQSNRVELAKGVTTCRLQVAVPPQVPMCLRMVRSSAERASGCDGDAEKDAMHSAPLVFEVSEEGRIGKAEWEVWGRAHRPPRWIKLPELLQAQAEAAWLEGQSSALLEVTPHEQQQTQSGDASASGNPSGLAVGRYELTFGDERRVQHSFRKHGPGGWQANARRSAAAPQGAEQPTKAQGSESDGQCVICMEHPRTHAFMHAETGDGHLAVCASCADGFRAEAVVGGGPASQRRCPMCRRPFTAVQRIYQ